MEEKQNNGITLIALVVTIVVLLILAGITINMLFSENGIITKAKDASEKTAKAEENEIAGMQNMADQMNEIINSVNKNEEPSVTLESLMTTTSDKNETVEDSYGNKIVIPAGFKVVPHGVSNVEYTYNEENGTSTNIPVVQDGIVIENVEDGNQFVWIPIGNIKNKDNTTTTIQLGRYSNFTVLADGTLPTPAQVASKTDYDVPVTITMTNDYKYIEISNDFTEATVGETTYGAASEYGNTKAYNLVEWISTTLDNGGYYIARYEASKNGEKAASKVSTGTPATSISTTITDGMLWNFITQPNAAIAAKKTYEYSADAKYYSDLINSYAWDTATIFIEAYSENSDYVNQNGGSINTILTNTGMNDDKACNIHDMIGNVREWTTEISIKNSEQTCACRGGSCYNVYYSIRERGLYYSANESNFSISFRIILCVK